MGGEARIACARQNAARNGAMSPSARRCSGDIGVGVLIVFFGVYMTSMARDPVAGRTRATAQSYVKSSDRKAIFKTPDKIRERLLKALIPEDRSERTMIRCMRM